VLPPRGRDRDESGRGALRSDLDVKGLNKPQVFGRIEELEAREREREELVAELVPTLKARGHGTVKVARDG
jgi:hypothetical protein